VEKVKPKKCKECGEIFTPERSFQPCCTIPCAIAYAKKKSALNRKKAQNRAKKAFRASDLPLLKKIAQQVFNRYVRLRDKDLPCISCGHSGNRQFHAGHYKSQGGNASLRFNEDNCHKQCSICNNYKSGNLAQYRINLIKKIGIKRVEDLENNRTTKSYTVEELKEIIEKYKAKYKELSNT